MPQQSKACAKCKQVKPASEYYKDKAAANGLTSYCRACHKVHQREWTKPNDSKIVLKTGLNKSYSLDELITAASIRGGKSHFTAKEAHRAVAVYINAKQNNIKIKEAYAKSGLNQAFQSFYLLITELKKAGRDGMTLEQYFEKGRPYSVAAQRRRVIVKRK